jgi:hypothetical protein
MQDSCTDAHCSEEANPDSSNDRVCVGLVSLVFPAKIKRIFLFGSLTLISTHVTRAGEERAERAEKGEGKGGRGGERKARGETGDREQGTGGREEE